MMGGKGPFSCICWELGDKTFWWALRSSLSSASVLLQPICCSKLGSLRISVLFLIVSNRHPLERTAWLKQLLCFPWLLKRVPLQRYLLPSLKKQPGCIAAYSAAPCSRGVLPSFVFFQRSADLEISLNPATALYGQWEPSDAWIVFHFPLSQS